MKFFVAISILLFSLVSSAEPDLSLLRCAKTQARLSNYERIAIERDEIATDKIIEEQAGLFNNKSGTIKKPVVCGMSRTERESIMSYTGNLYLQVNRALRKNEKLEYFLPYIRTLVRALRKLAPYNGTVVRGSNLGGWEQWFMMIGVKRTFKDRGFLSTSRKTPFGSTFKLTIKSKSCRYIAPFSFVPEEDEVLCLPFTKFKVKDISIDRTKGTGNLILEE